MQHCLFPLLNTQSCASPSWQHGARPDTELETWKDETRSCMKHRWSIDASMKHRRSIDEAIRSHRLPAEALATKAVANTIPPWPKRPVSTMVSWCPLCPPFVCVMTALALARWPVGPLPWLLLTSWNEVKASVLPDSSDPCLPMRMFRNLGSVVVPTHDIYIYIYQWYIMIRHHTLAKFHWQYHDLSIDTTKSGFMDRWRIIPAHLNHSQTRCG